MVDLAQDVTDAVAGLESRRQSLRDHLAKLPKPPGLVPVDDATFMAAVQTMRQQFPPVPIRFPDGSVHVESPWIVMLGITKDDGSELVAGSGDVLHRIELIQEKAQP